MAAQLARREAKWLRGYTAHLVGIPPAATAVLTHLAGEDEARAAFELAGALLAPCPAKDSRAGVTPWLRGCRNTSTARSIKRPGPL